MNSNFHVGWCPFCNQGWIDIVKEADSNKLFLLCMECDTLWEKPEDIEIARPLVDYHFSGVSIELELKEIEVRGWTDFLITLDNM